MGSIATGSLHHWAVIDAMGGTDEHPMTHSQPTTQPELGLDGAGRFPELHFRTAGLSDADALAHWREVMAPLFRIEQPRYTRTIPRGNLSVFVVGEIIVNRCTFNAQHLSRDPHLIATTPDHLVLQYYRSGGFRGVIAGQPVCIVRGQVAVADLGQEIDSYAARSDTIGLSVPRSLLNAIDPTALRRQLDTPRNRLLGGYMANLPKRVARACAADAAVLTAEIVTLLERVFAPGPLNYAAPVAANETLLDRALALVEAHLGNTDLSPSFAAGRLGISRATLFRLFAPMGGIMRYVQERRLLALRDTLDDPLDTRSLAQLGSAHGFKSPAVLSRTFRARFAASPREWRRRRVARDLAERDPSAAASHAHWRGLGRASQEA